MKKLIPFLYIAFICVSFSFGQDKDKVKLVGHWEGKDIPPTSAYNNKYQDVWGFAQGEKEYAVIGTTLGTHIIDVTDPANLKEVVKIPGKATGKSIVHRDFHEHNGYLYMVADEGNSSLQIADVREISSTGKAPVVYDSNELIITSHNIFIDSSENLLYACGVANSSGRKHLVVYSLEDPAKPKHIKDFTLNYYHDIFVRNGIAYGNCGNSGLFVVDFADPTSPKQLGKLTSYPDKGYNHSGWTTEDGKYYFLADENHGMKIKSLDVSDLSDIKALTTFGSGVNKESVPHNLIVSGNYLYVSYYHDGFYVFDITDPRNPKIGGYYDTFASTNYSSYKGSWGIYPFLPSGNILMSDMQTGLYVFDVSDIVTGVDEDPVSSQQGKDNFLIQFNANTNNVVLINRFSKQGNFDVQLVDANGKVINETGYEFMGYGKKILSVNPNLEKGIYFVRIFNNEYSQSQKFVKVN